MAIPVVLLSAIFSSLLLLCLSESTAPISQTDKEPSSPNHQLIRELDDAKLRIARLESVFEETVQDLNSKSLYLEERKKQIEEMTRKIDNLQSALSSLKDDSSHENERINALEEEVRLLWQTSRKNNFELHNLESKAQDAENRLKFLASQVKKMADIVTEQWIQIQQLEQGLQIAEMKIQKIRRQVSSGRSTSLKFIRTLFGSNLQTLTEVLGPLFFERRSKSGSYMSRALHQLKLIFSAAKQYHHKLQSFIKREMEKNEFTAALANQEVVFFVASTLIIFPMMSAWMLLSSQFS